MNFPQALLSTLTLAGLLFSASAHAQAELHPSGGESLADGASMCAQLFKQDKAHGIKVLVIAVEGLGGFNGSATRASYEYLENLRDRNADHQAPGVYGNGFLLRRLVQPLYLKYGNKLDYIVFPETSVPRSGDSVAAECAAAWVKGANQDEASKGRKLVLLGHSYGGHAVSSVTEELNKRGVKVDAVFTMDARTKQYIGKLQRTPNVVRWENYYQRNNPLLPGYVVPDADINKNMSETGVGHGTIVSSPEVHKAVMGTISKFLAGLGQ